MLCPFKGKGHTGHWVGWRQSSEGATLAAPSLYLHKRVRREHVGYTQTRHFWSWTTNQDQTHPPPVNKTLDRIYKTTVYWPWKPMQNCGSWEKGNKQGSTATLDFCLRAHSGPRSRMRGSTQSMPQKQRVTETEPGAQRGFGNWKLWARALEMTELQNHWQGGRRENTKSWKYPIKPKKAEKGEKRKKKQIQQTENKQQGSRLKSTL